MIYLFFSGRRRAETPIPLRVYRIILSYPLREFIESAPEKGRKMLNDNSNLWMYLPRTSKVMKLPFKQSFMGSDASNRDLLKINFQEDYNLLQAVPLGDTLVRLELKARDLTISYNKVIVWFDLRKQIISRQEMYSLSGKLMKTMIYE